MRTEGLVFIIFANPGCLSGEAAICHATKKKEGWKRGIEPCRKPRKKQDVKEAASREKWVAAMKKHKYALGDKK